MYSAVNLCDPDSFEFKQSQPDSKNGQKDEQNIKKDVPFEAEDQLARPMPYPKSIFFIISNEFCERFSYYGMRTILSLYLRDILLYTENTSKIIYHTFSMLVYFFPTIGAIISDSCLGKFNTILYVSIIYACGNVVLAMAAIDPLHLPQRVFSIAGLFLIAIGTGGIKPCVSAFGGDQFVLPQQEHQLAMFFSMFYFAINAGSLISTSITPILRNDVHCFANNHCFPLAFAVPGILMIISVVIFAVGRPLYNIRKPEGNVIVKMGACIAHAIKKKAKSNERKEHWLDHAEDVYGPSLVHDVKITLKVLFLYLPLPIFWALYDQQGSGWTFQAARMNGDLGFYTILPDQMQVVNPFLILAFIPMFTYGIYPLLAKCNILNAPLQRMACGGFLAAVAFAMSAFVSLALEETYPVLPTNGNAQIRIYNTLNCDVNINHSLGPPITVPALGYYKNLDIDVKGYKDFIVTDISGCEQYQGGNNFTFRIEEKTSTGYLLTSDKFTNFRDNIEKNKMGLPVIRVLVNNGRANFTLNFMAGKESVLNISSANTSQVTINPETYNIKGLKKDFKFALGGVYAVLLELKDDQLSNGKLLEITQPNTVHMLWLIPQYIVITAAEIMFSITGLEFSYSQAPISMKAVLQAAFLLTTAFGNLIIVLIESASIFETQSSDFFLYTGLMVADMVCFAFMAKRYKPVPTATSENIAKNADTANEN